MVRFSLVLPAIIHDNLSMSEAFGFSFQKITFKRAGLIFLIGIVFIIATSMVTGIFSLIINLALGNNENLLMVSFIINQGFSLIIGGLSGAFIFAALSALYYRYTEHGKDDSEEENFDAHVIDSN
jgi:membrane-anchored glycerophosphoryl diester phosphodiesterase (GDPDase)